MLKIDIESHKSRESKLYRNCIETVQKEEKFESSGQVQKMNLIMKINFKRAKMLLNNTNVINCK